MENTAFSSNGGLTLVALPGFLTLAETIKPLIERRGEVEKKPTPVDIVKPEFGLRASGEPFIRLGKDHVGGHDCMVLTSGPGTYEMLGQLGFALAYLAGRHARRITVIAGYMPLSRSDKDEGKNELATVKHVVDQMFDAAKGNLNRIIAADLHVPQIVMAGPGLGSLTEIHLGRHVLRQAFKDAMVEHADRPMCLLLPDDGACKKFQEDIKHLEKELGQHIPVVFGQKRRDSDEKSKLQGLFGDAKAMRGALVLAMDDEIATGGTLAQTARAVKENYAAEIFWSVAIHGVLCGKAVSILSGDSPIDRTYITDTIPTHHRPALAPLLSGGRLRVVPWAPELANIIYFHHWDHSIREQR